MKKPTTISNPGRYIVAKSFVVESGDGVTIAASHVDLDLNGHTISSAQVLSKLITINDGADFIRISNGHLSGGGYGVFADVTNGIALWLENLEIDGSASDGVHVKGAGNIEMVHTKVINTGNRGVFIDGVGTTNPVTGRFVGNTIDGAIFCLSLLRPRNVLIRDNTVTNCGQQGIQLSITTSSGALARLGANHIQGNTVAGCSIGIGLLSAAPGNVVFKNTVKENAIGIVVESDQNRVAENVVTESTSAISAAAGISVGGSRNLVEGNVVEGTTIGCGIRFFGATAAQNAYRANMLRGNAGGAVCDTGVGTTDAGGNIL